MDEMPTQEENQDETSEEATETRPFLIRHEMRLPPGQFPRPVADAVFNWIPHIIRTFLMIQAQGKHGEVRFHVNGDGEQIIALCGEPAAFQEMERSKIIGLDGIPIMGGNGEGR